jgi:hypothetical protein
LRIAYWFYPAALALMPSAAPAADFWSWHAFDYPIIQRGRLEVAAYGRLRTEGSGLEQTRLGPTLDFNLHPRFSLTGGYYWSEENDDPGWDAVHRLFGGFEAPLVRARGVELSWRGLVERHLEASRPDHTRFRQRIRLETNRRIGPAASVEWLREPRGSTSWRYSAGVLYLGKTFSEIEVAYLYDSRPAADGGDRHGVTTRFSLARRR